MSRIDEAPTRRELVLTLVVVVSILAGAQVAQLVLL